MRSLYEVDLLTDLQIANVVRHDLGKSCSLHENTVARWRKKFGIQTITFRQRRERKTPSEIESLDSLTPEILATLYASMGDRKIAQIYGVQKPAIQRLRQQWGISSISKKERATSSYYLSEEQKDILIGCVLGDGHLLERGVFKVSHAHHQYLYLNRVWEKLAPIARPLFYGEKRMKESGELRFEFGFRTTQHTWLQDLRQRFYPQGVKVFPKSVLDTLSIRSVAYWYFDDGHLDSNLPSIALGNLDDGSIGNAKEALFRLGFDVYLSPRSTATCKILGFRSSSTARFFEQVAPYATSDMLHKIPEKYRPFGIKPYTKILSFEEPLPKGLPLSASSLMSYWVERGYPHSVTRREEIDVLKQLQFEHVIQKGVIKDRQIGESWQAFDQSQTFEGSGLNVILGRMLSKGTIPSPPHLRRCLQENTQTIGFSAALVRVIVGRYLGDHGVVIGVHCGGAEAFGALVTGVTYCVVGPFLSWYGDLAKWVGGNLNKDVNRGDLVLAPQGVQDAARFFQPGTLVLVRGNQGLEGLSQVSNWKTSTGDISLWRC